jgi:hypothetical protein
MKQVIWKLFTDHEKEEKWLNEMSQKGLQLVHYTPGRYLFEEGQQGHYIYRIELLDQLPSHPESRAYIRFMEEAGAEYVTHILRWVYFRKKASDGPFELYTDRESRMTHHKRIMTLYGVLGGVNIVTGINIVHNSTPGLGLLPYTNLLLGFLFARIAYGQWVKIKRLKADEELFQ